MIEYLSQSEYLEVLAPLMKATTSLGTPILVDEQDKDLLIYNWSESSQGYPSNSINGKFAYMHRVIMERVLGRKLTTKEFVDHINGNGSDNRRSNLRVATDSQNKANSKRRVSSNKHRGVYPDKRVKSGSSKAWRAYITVEGKQRCIGYFHTEEEAVEARDKAALEAWGEFARLNHA